MDVLAGGPPCQGFSSAGRRVQQDPRNHLFKLYAEVAEALQPPFLVFENVPGIAEVFDKQDRRFRNPTRIGRPPVPYSERIAKKLGQLGYEVVGLHERAVDFGVPQNRTRYLMVGVHRATGLSISPDLVRGLLATHRNDLLRELELVGPITLQEAISDLETHGRRLIPCVDSLGFNQLDYQGPLTQYQRIMRDGATEAPNSMRLANQRPDTVARLAQILATCRKDVRLLRSEREALGIGKQSITPLAPNRPAKTVTSLPDDFIHYSEPRILTVRECARIQSFPDWFSFHGKYTTGGPKRTVEVPRYTQVANAVPPLLARVVGLTLQHLHSQIAVADSREEQFVPAALTV